MDWSRIGQWRTLRPPTETETQMMTRPVPLGGFDGAGCFNRRKHCRH